MTSNHPVVTPYRVDSVRGVSAFLETAQAQIRTVPNICCLERPHARLELLLASHSDSRLASHSACASTRSGTRSASRGHSVVNYALLDASLAPLGPARQLRLTSQSSAKIKMGAEDARLVAVERRTFLLYNDALS